MRISLGGVVAEDHDLLRRLAVRGRPPDPEAAALFEEQVDDGQVPLGLVLRQPFAPSSSVSAGADGFDGCQFFQRAEQVVADGGLSSTR
jgi:hypothetical protein